MDFLIGEITFVQIKNNSLDVLKFNNLVRFFIAKKFNKNEIKLGRSPPLQILKIRKFKIWRKRK